MITELEAKQVYEGPYIPKRVKEDLSHFSDAPITTRNLDPSRNTNTTDSVEVLYNKLKYLLLDDFELISYRYLTFNLKINVEKSNYLLNKFINNYKKVLKKNLVIHYLITGEKNIKKPDIYSFEHLTNYKPIDINDFFNTKNKIKN